MAGNRAGGKKAAATNKRRHGDDFYARIGAKGGRNGNTGGFAANPELAREAGRKGGRISKRCSFVNRSEQDENGTVIDFEWCKSHERGAEECRK